MLKESRRNIPVAKKGEIIRLASEGFTHCSIAEHVGVNKNTVTNVLRRELGNKEINEQELLGAILCLMDKEKFNENKV